MYRTIMVPLDGSALAERALPLAESLAARGGGRLVLIRAAEAHPCPGADRIEAQRAAVAIAETYLAEVAGRSDSASGVECRVYYGAAVHGILAEAQLREADLLVMSTHGRGGLGRWLYGSVADRVLRHATVPMLLVPAACDQTWDGQQPVRLLLPLDGSDFGLEALGAVRRLAHVAGADGADVALLHVIEPARASVYATEPLRQTIFDEEAELAAARRSLQRIGGALGIVAREVTVHAAIGAPAVKITALARAWPADIVVMATHGRSGLSRLVLGSVATETLQRASTPLLVRPTGVRRPVSETAGRTRGAGVPWQLAGSRLGGRPILAGLAGLASSAGD